MYISKSMIQWPRVPMDKASAYGAGDCRFESCRGPRRHRAFDICRKESLRSSRSTIFHRGSVAGRWSLPMLAGTDSQRKKEGVGAARRALWRGNPIPETFPIDVLPASQPSQPSESLPRRSKLGLKRNFAPPDSQQGRGMLQGQAGKNAMI